MLAHQIGEVFDIDSNNLRNPRFNLEYLYKYFRFQIKVRKRVDGKETIYRTPMVPCTEEHFRLNNFFPDETSSKNYFSKRICPDIEAMKDFWILRNGYTNMTERQSFNMQVALCNQTNDASCRDPADISFLLDKLFFTIYVVEDNVQFGDIGKNPFMTVNKFHSQFALNIEEYRDNNNFIKVNKATSSDTRNPLKSKNKDYYFLNSVLGPVWVSKTWKKTENITEDGGKTYF